jgi:signal transduction histidine kinase
MVLFAAGQVHGELWPSAYTSIITLSDLLRLAFVLLVAAGAAITLLRVADEREAMLALEQTRTRELGELAEAHRDVTAIVTHELAAPLGAIRRLVDTVGTGDLSPPEQVRAMIMIEAEAGMLSALVADIQSLAMADRWAKFPLELQQVRLSELVRTAAVFAESLPGYHPLNVEVTVPEECDVVADPQRLAQVLRNLVSNAAKFSNPGSPIGLRASPSEADCVTVEVRDEGWGITEGDLGRIFEKYRRGSTDGPTPGGLGIGLYISQRIVEAHESRIEVESEAGKGSTFRFELKSVL